MTTVKQLYCLQEVDLDLDGVNVQIAAVERELEGRLSLGKIEESLEQAKVRLQEIQSAHRQLQHETESQRERSNNLDTQLYGGDVANPRDLEALQLEANNVRHLLEQMDVRLLELSLQAEDARSSISGLEQELSGTQTAWDTRQAELWKQLEELTDKQEALGKDRTSLAAGVDSVELSRYEGLRRSKRGQAIARVVRGLCQACRMSLPSQHLQRVRSGRQTVLCNSCGRMLLPG
jgi:predicted  nucleic acid-binding Zn-ribbon protein